MQHAYIPKKYYIRTYGCQANIADSNTIAGILEALGCEEVKDIKKADIAVVNTCSIRQKSEDKVFGLGKLYKGDNAVFAENKPFTIMAGCMVGSVTGTRPRYALEELRKKTPWVDAYINPNQIQDVPKILLQNNILDDWAIKKFDANALNKKVTDRHAFINISQGCDNFCTFCVVPYARGQEISRSEAEVLQEIKHFIKRGVTEITLCGQNVNSWGLAMDEKFAIRTGSNQKLPFAQLLRKIHDFKEIQKIDFISSNPFDFTEDLISALKLPKVANYLHMAVQSGNNEILRKMNRRHTIEDFYTLIARIKQEKPEIELGTDIIVGFPGETHEQFMDTVRLFERITFNVAFISIYSPRKGTPAERFFEDNVSARDKKWRHAHLTKVWQDSLRTR